MKRGREDSVLGADGQHKAQSHEEEAEGDDSGSRVRSDQNPPSNLLAARMVPSEPSETTMSRQARSSLLQSNRAATSNASTGISSSSAAERAAIHFLNSSAASQFSPSWSSAAGDGFSAIASSPASRGAAGQLQAELLLRQLGTVAPPGVLTPHHEGMLQITSTLGQHQWQHNANAAEASLMDRLGVMTGRNLLLQQLQQQSISSSPPHQHLPTAGGFPQDVLRQLLLTQQTNPPPLDSSAATTAAAASLGVAQTVQHLLAEQQLQHEHLQQLSGSDMMQQLQNQGAAPLLSSNMQQELAQLLILRQQLAISRGVSSLAHSPSPLLPPLTAAADLGRVMARAGPPDITATSVTNEREQLNSSLLSTLLKQHQQHQQQLVPKSAPPLGQSAPPPPASLSLQSPDAPSSPRPDHSVHHGGGANEKQETDKDDGFAIPLSVPQDHGKLSEYQILIREQLEVFAATESHVSSNKQGRKKRIVLGQVGLRCKHCRARNKKNRGSVYFPGKLRNVYQACQNMAASHLMESSCGLVPPQIQQRLLQLRNRHHTAIGGKKYWAEACQQLGVYEVPDGGLRLSVSQQDQAGAGSGSAAAMANDDTPPTSEKAEQVAGKTAADDDSPSGSSTTEDAKPPAAVERPSSSEEP